MVTHLTVSETINAMHCSIKEYKDSRELQDCSAFPVTLASEYRQFTPAASGKNP
jgi:hypothetical protein